MSSSIAADSSPTSRKSPQKVNSTDSKRPQMPTRSNSTLTGIPPADAIKADDEAVSEIYDQVSQTGSLSVAARKLQKYARAWEDDPEEKEYLEQMRTKEAPAAQVKPAATPATAPKMSLAQQRMMQAFADEEEGNGDDNQDEDVDMNEDNAVFDDDDEEEQEVFSEPEVTHLQEIQEGLWIGDLVAAMDTAGLEAKGISNIVSLLRPRLSFPPNFDVYALEIDDAPDTDILTHLPGAVQWVEAALEKRASMIKDGDEATEPRQGGVLIHCQAGVSRSSTVMAACLMRAKDLDPVEAVELIRQQRAHVDPSETFWRQLELYHKANGKVSLRDKSTRQFYMERTTSEFMNGDGSAPAMDKMAKYPATPTPSNPATPSGGHGRRKIRCKMCRRHLAVREHMMDHILDQAPPASRPRTPSNFALPSPRLSISAGSDGPLARPRRGSAVSHVINPLTGLPGATKSRQGSFSNVPALSPLSPMTPGNAEPSFGFQPPVSPGAGVPMPKPNTQSSLSTNGSVDQTQNPIVPGALLSAPPSELPKSGSADSGKTRGRQEPGPRQFQSADQLSSRLPPQLLALRQAGSSNNLSSPIGSSPASSPDRESTSHAFPTSQGTQGSQGTQTAARRMSMLTMTPAEGSHHERKGSNASDIAGYGGAVPNSGPPILVNPKCSGYFVEPLTWMEGMLKTGNISGKIVCPNEKCGAKIGNFDWAGVQCGCKEWVTPGFCISRSKVDEVW